MDDQAQGGHLVSLIDILKCECERRPGTVILVDTSVLDYKPGYSLAKVLYDSWSGLQRVDTSHLASGIARLNELEQLPTLGTVVIVREVVIEMRRNLEIINAQIQRLQKRLDNRYTMEEIGRRRYQKLRPEFVVILEALSCYTNKVHEYLKTTDNREHRIRFHEPHERMYAELTQIARDDQARFARSLSRQDRATLDRITSTKNPHSDARARDYDGLATVDFATYAALLKTAVEKSHDDRLYALRRNATIVKTNPQGFFLNTDRKIVATAFALAHHAPTVVVSNDLGLRRVMGRVQNSLSQLPKSLPNFLAPDIPVEC